MSAGAPIQIINGPGKLIVGPTQAFDGGTYPYGGTEVGYVQELALVSRGESFPVFSEGLGGFNDILEANNDYSVAFFLRGWDDDALQKFMPGGYSQGTVTQHSIWSAPGSQTPGQTELGHGLVVAFVPDDLLAQNGLILHNMIPGWDEGASIAFSRKDPAGIPISGQCLRNGSGNILKIGRLPDLSLT